MVLHNGGAQPSSFPFISALGPPCSPVPRCSHSCSLVKNYHKLKIIIIIIIATLNHCPKWSNQPLLLHMRTKELMRQMGSPSSSQIQPMEISGIPHSEDDTKSPLCAATSSCNKAEINASVLYLSKSTQW